MGFKSKIKPKEVKDLDFKTYTTVLRKEVKTAAKFGETAVVAFSNYEFACGHVGTLLLLGKFSGDLAKFYKKAKIERKKENDFARGTCYFETEENGNVTMHIALKEGKGKPDKLKKNGKALFKKLGFEPNIFKGDLPVVEEGVDLSQEEIEHIETVADKENALKTLASLVKAYEGASKRLANEVLPLIKQKEGAVYRPLHFEIAREAFKASASFLEKYEEVEEKKREKFTTIYEKIEKRHEQLQKNCCKSKKRIKQ